MTIKIAGPGDTVRWNMENGDRIDVEIAMDWHGNQVLRLTTISPRVPSLTITPRSGNSIFVRAGG